MLGLLWRLLLALIVLCSALSSRDLVERAGASGASVSLGGLFVDAEDLLAGLASLQRSRRRHTNSSSDDACKALHDAASCACRVHQDTENDFKPAAGGGEAADQRLLVRCLQLARTELSRAVGEEDPCRVAPPAAAHTLASPGFFVFQPESSIQDVLDGRLPRGRCLFTTRFCPIHSELSGQMVDERDNVYRELAMLPDDDARKRACLARAKDNWCIPTSPCFCPTIYSVLSHADSGL